MSDTSILELIRITIPPNEELASGNVSNFFDVHVNSQNLTEEFLYSHQPVSDISFRYILLPKKLLGN